LAVWRFGGLGHSPPSKKQRGRRRRRKSVDLEGKRIKVGLGAFVMKEMKDWRKEIVLDVKGNPLSKRLGLIRCNRSQALDRRL